MPYDVGEDFNPLTIPAVMPKSVRRTAEDGTPTQAALDYEQAVTAWMRDNVANTNTRLTLVKDAADGLEASVTTERNARIDGDEALADYDLTLLSRVDDISANASIKAATKAAPTGAAAAIGLYTTVDNAFAGFEIINFGPGNSAIGLTANKFKFVDSGTAVDILTYSAGTFTFNSNVKINGDLNINSGTVVTSNVATDAITKSAGFAANATITGVVVDVRAGATVVITGVFNGIPGVYFPLGTFIGTVDILRNGSIIKSVGNNFEASGTGGSAAVSFNCTVVQVIDTPGAGIFTYEIETTNGGGVGGVSIVVQELVR